MVASAIRSPADWFAEAARVYVEQHQACPYCLQRHCVYRKHEAGRIEYYCRDCDFSTCHDEQTGRDYVSCGNDAVVIYR